MILEPKKIKCAILSTVSPSICHEVMGLDAMICVDHNKLWNILKEMEYQTTWPASWETYMQVRKQQLELDMEQQTGSK